VDSRRTRGRGRIGAKDVLKKLWGEEIFSVADRFSFGGLVGKTRIREDLRSGRSFLNFRTKGRLKGQRREPDGES